MDVSSGKLYTLSEFGGFTRAVKSPKYVALPEKTFDSLEAFVVANEEAETGKGVKLLHLSNRRKVGKIIAVRNYAGFIAMNDGTIVEVLPKFFDKSLDEIEKKKLFLEMLQSLINISGKDFVSLRLHTARLNLFETFMKTFLDQIELLTRRNVKSTVKARESMVKTHQGGNSDTKDSEDLADNREKIVNKPENRLIKNTLRHLLALSSDMHNRLVATRLLFIFENIPYSEDTNEDFSKCFIDRSMDHYKFILFLCRMFLKGNCFTNYNGSDAAFALLLPMDTLFESYVFSKLRDSIGDEFKIKTQLHSYTFFDRPSQSFAYNPGIEIETDEGKIILIARWKELSERLENCGISQSDVKQLQAIAKNHGAKKIFLLFPFPETLREKEPEVDLGEDINAAVVFVDLNKEAKTFGEELLLVARRGV